MSHELVVEAVDRALCFYDANNVDVVKNEETGMLDVMYHNNNNSFGIDVDIVNARKVNKAKLIKELDQRGVGYCW